ncbi:hypothetical protein K6V92_10470 [Cupriavidus respiraculi]|uniref:hypothetical protein n=1 Tax=Cupriavidus respiraculi TaxID=195930 RepID=UPI001C979FA4|nr:hypothetical protein [Cupriavidus respiraculi]MBY4947042.1 hypothetical protein [Cupriavidus respiraculi]
MPTKVCFKCLAEKPLSDFYKHSAMSDKHLNKCKECTKADVARHRQENLERIRAYDKLRGSMPHRVAARKEYRQTEEGKLALARAHKWQKQKFPDRDKARNAVNNAVRDGRLEKQPCLICGASAEAHHADYSRPLDVVWLCNRHHREAHAIVKELEMTI